MGKEINYKLIAQLSCEKLLRNHDRFTGKFPHISNICRGSNKLDYRPEENNIWTSSFYPGEMYLAYALTGDEAYLADSEAYLDSFEHRLDNRIGMSHDLGFLYTLSCVALHKLTGNRRAGDIAMRAADALYERYVPEGRYIQAWGDMNVGDPYVRIIADTMLNLPLLYWSGREEHLEAARNHAFTCAKYIVRDDYSSFHTYLMDPVSKRAIEGRTHQGYRDSSTWARGQAWIVYGFALSYGYTGEEEFLKTAVGAADYFFRRLPEDYVAYWDLTFNDEVPDIRDTSAAAILASGLLELAGLVEEAEKRSRYLETAKLIVRSLYENYFVPDMDSPVLLKDGMYHRDHGSTGTVWGDYFFLEALLRLEGSYIRFW